MTTTHSSTLLCLLSEQRMQNIIPVFQRGADFQRVALLASALDGAVNPRFARAAEDLRAALAGRAEVTLWPNATDPMDPDAAARACAEMVSACGSSSDSGAGVVTINLTGGTKPMSIGAYQAGLALGAPMLYVDTQAEQIIHYAAGQSPRAEPFRLEPIRVAQALAAHGKPVNHAWTLSKQPSPAEEALTRAVFARRPSALADMLALQHLLRRLPFDEAGEKVLDPTLAGGAAWLVEQMRELGLARSEGGRVCLNRAAARYADGGWLEQYVAAALRADGRFADVAGNLQIAEIENELDVACTLNGKLALVECKSGKIEGGEGAAMVNRLRALQQSLAGTFGKTFLVTCLPAARISRRLMDRAREYVSCVIGLEDLGRVEQVIYDAVARKGR